MRILLTGVTGFIGINIANKLKDFAEVQLTVAVRRKVTLPDFNVVQVNQLDPQTDWSAALNSADVVIHAAGRAHIMKEYHADPLAEFRRVNVDGTLNFARQAVVAGVKRFIYISSIKVNGEQTSIGQPFTAADTPAPEDAFGISKLEAEQGLQQLATETGMEVVIIRPTLVYGPGAKGNFSSLVKLVEKGMPLPFGAVRNQRSFVALDNLVDLIITCIDRPAAANQVFLASDGQDLSLTELLQGVAKAMGKPSQLMPVPSSLLMLGAILLGKKSRAQRFLGSLQVDISKARDLLGWEPPISVEEGLRRCFESQERY